MNLEQLRDLIVAPTLEELGMYSKSAERLVIGTGLVESGFEYIQQIDGPALGFYQMEPSTHDDIWNNYLLYRPHLAKKFNGFNIDCRDPDQLAWNLKYATAMCRMHYYRNPFSLPDEDDIVSMANIWKDVYNTNLGKGSTDYFISKASKVLEL
ncbi:MAG: hypothetical protein O7D95_05100 [Betaproteobacteria bacterium]|nr:hypothetical protein [Betaproteobacteria bacterium]